MKATFRTLLLAGLCSAVLPVHARENEPAPSEESSASRSSLVTASFRNVTVGEIADFINQATTAQYLVPEDLRDFPIQDLSFRNVPPDVVAESINVLSGGKLRYHQFQVGEGQERSLVIAFEPLEAPTGPNATDHEPPFVIFSFRGIPAEQRPELIETFISAAKAGLKALARDGETGATRIEPHPPSGLVFASGPEPAMKVLIPIARALGADAQPAFGSPARGVGATQRLQEQLQENARTLEEKVRQLQIQLPTPLSPAPGDSN